MCQTACQDDSEDDDSDTVELAEHDCALVESAGDLLPTLAKLIGGPTFAPYFTQLLPDLLKRLVSYLARLRIFLAASLDLSTYDDNSINNCRSTAVIQVNVCWPAPPVKNWRILQRFIAFSALNCLLCFDTVGWVGGRASGL